MDLIKETSNRIVQMGQKYPVWYKDRKFFFSVDSWIAGGGYRYSIEVFEAYEATGWFGGKKTKYELIRSREVHTITDPDCPFESRGRCKECYFNFLWPDLQKLLDEIFLSYVVDKDPFVIECSKEFYV